MDKKLEIDPIRAELIEKQITNMFVMLGHLAPGELTSIQIPWHEVYIIIPRKTINGKWVWCQRIYKRRVWRVTKFVTEPFNEYGTVFDLI